jgi:Glycosyltransferase family 87
LHLLFFIGLREQIKQGAPDFTVYYTAATMLRSGQGRSLYDPKVQFEVQKAATGRISSGRGPLPYIHPPFEALLFLPLAWLPYAKAFALWDLLNVGILFGVAVLLRRSISTLRRISPWQLVVVSLCFFPVFICLLQGQDSILLLLLCVLAFDALKKKRDLVAGVWLALGMFKFQFMIPVFLLLGLWKERRAAIGFAGVSAALVFISAGMAGWQSLLQYPAFALQTANSPGSGGVPPEFLPNLRGLVVGWPFPLSTLAGTAIVLLSSVALFAFAVTRRAEGQTESLDLRFSLAIIVSTLIAWQTNMHDLSLLVLPIILIWEYWLTHPGAEARRKFALLAPVLPLLVSPLCIVFWLVIHTINVIAIPLLWWSWEVGRELSRPAFRETLPVEG